MSLNYQTFAGICGTQLRVIDGLAIDAGLGGVDSLLLDDVYRLHPDAGSVKIQAVADQIRLADCRSALTAEALLTFMTPTGHRLLAVLLSAPERIVILPLGYMDPSVPYRLVACDSRAAREGFERVRSGAFARGTRITMADGSLRQIERVQPGDLVRTTGHGVQTVTGTADYTQHLSPDMALVAIASGNHGNPQDVVLRPEQRFFAASSQVSIATLARDAVNNRDIRFLTTGARPMVQLFFDVPCAIVANGLSVETHVADVTSGASKPGNLARMLQVPAPDGLKAANTHPNPARVDDYALTTTKVSHQG